MTRKEEIIRTAKQKEKEVGFTQIVKDAKGVNSAYGIGFLEGAEWADKHQILEVKEEPVSVWHNMGEVPIKGEVIVVQTKDTFYGLSVQKGGSTYKNRNKDRYVRWAYASDLLHLSNVQRTVKNWKEPVSKDLEEAAWLYYDKNRLPIPPEWDLHKEFIDFFKAGTNWQKENLWKDAQGDELPEIDREVVALIQDYPDDKEHLRIAYAHRPPEYWDGKNILTGKVTRYEPKRHDKGGWNLPNVKYWLDVELPKGE